MIQFISALGATAVALSAWLFAPSGTLVLSCAFGWTLLALSIFDFQRFVLPDPLNLLAALLGVAMVAVTRPHAWPDHLIGGLAGFLVLLGVELAYRQLRGREGLGRGDAKLLGALGIWVGWSRLPDILLIASLGGLIAAASAALVLRKPIDGTGHVAFGPWLALAGWIAWLSGPILVPAV